MSMTPEKRFLGIDRLPSSDRGALGLPEDGQLRSGQVEAALEQLVDIIARHPLGGSAEAKRLAARLEYSADRLQAEIALAGKGPLHPAAARRAALSYDWDTIMGRLAGYYEDVLGCHDREVELAIPTSAVFA